MATTIDGTKTANLGTLRLRHGMPWTSGTFQLATSAGAAIVMTGWAFRGQIKARSDSATVVAVVTGELVDAAAGKFRLAVSLDEARKLAATGSSPTQASTYVFDGEWYESATGTPKRALVATVSVTPSGTYS